MATPSPDYKFTETRGRNSIYPWDQWLNGETWKITRKTDFFVLCTSMQDQIYQQAIRRGMRAKVSVEGDDIYLKASRSRPTGVTLDGNGNTIRRTQ